MSLSARRAWIEITMRRDFKVLGLVALRKESVDRNILLIPLITLLITSLSARRAWIEIIVILRKTNTPSKSLSARRAWIEIA